MQVEQSRWKEAGGCAPESPGRLGSDELAVLISCVGRKVVLTQRDEEGVEAIGDVLGSRALLTGFYSYGEICGVLSGAPCELHNQTMTITVFSER